MILAYIVNMFTLVIKHREEGCIGEGVNKVKNSNVQRFLTKFFRGVFGRSTSSTVLCISVLSFVMLCSSSCVALCCVAIHVVFLSFPRCVALCCVAICCVYRSCLFPVVLRCVVLRFATVSA